MLGFDYNNFTTYSYDWLYIFNTYIVHDKYTHNNYYFLNAIRVAHCSKYIDTLRDNSNDQY